MKRTIYYLGNEFIEKDNLAILIVNEIKDKFPDILFKKINTFDDLIDFSGKEYFIDVAKGIDRVRLITDIKEFEGIKSATAHDIDFSFFLQLNNKLGHIDKIKIICLPQEKYKNIKDDVINIIKKI
jgi:uncharacterized secreted protein with C-terminal beta-propeller domain